MTGRDLILYILANHLEEEKIEWFMTLEEAAVKLNTGVATIETLIKLQQLKTIEVWGQVYICPVLPIEKKG